MAVGAVGEVDGMADTALDTAATDAAADTRHYLVLPAELVRHGEVVHAAVKQVGGIADAVGTAGTPQGGGSLTGDQAADAAFTRSLTGLSYALRTLGTKIDSVAGRAAGCAGGYRDDDRTAADRYAQCVLRTRQ
jgi:hypothetical protein